MAGITNAVGGAALVRGIRSDFMSTAQSRYEGLAERMGKVMQMGISSTVMTELYAYWEWAPHPVRRPWNQGVRKRAIRARNFPAANVSWDIAVTWLKHQRIFDQLQGLELQAKLAGENFILLPERVFFQILQGTVDFDLLASIQNAPDGVGIYSAIDGDGADRFGVPGGNIVTGFSIASSDAVRDGYYDGLERIGEFQTTEGQPMWTPEKMDQGITIFFGNTNRKVFEEAFLQGRTLEGGAAVTNIIMDSGKAVSLIPTQRITSDEMFMFVDSVEPKTVFEQVALALEEHIQIEDNSDIARNDKEEGVFFESYRGFGTNLPLGTVRNAA